MTTSHTRDNIRWKLYLRSGPVEIWEGRPLPGSPSGGWVTWEVRNDLTKEIQRTKEVDVMTTFNQMLLSLTP